MYFMYRQPVNFYLHSIEHEPLFCIGYMEQYLNICNK